MPDLLAPPTGAESVRWNLADLYPDTDAFDADLDAAEVEAERFAETYRGRLAGLSAAELAEALAALEAVHDRLGRAATYAYLAWSTDTEDAERGALLQRMRERTTQAGQRLIFFDVEWAGLSEEAVAGLLADDALARYRHHLELLHLRRAHVLSEDAERVLAEKAVTGNAAWNRFFDETLGAARFELRGETLPKQTVLAKLHEHDRSLRRDAALAVTEGLEALARPLTYVFNTVLADKASTDRLRHYDHWLAARNLDNEIADASVEALIDAVTSRYDLSERFYGLKRRLLGLDELMDYDRYAPVGETERRYDWAEARDTVLDAYTAFHPQMGAITERFFDGRWIDAPVAPGKRGGAFSHGAVPSAHPYILMNFTGRVRDVQTLAHELGHGVHQYLAREQGVFHAGTPLTTAETASVFGEMLVFQRLLGAETEPAARLAMLVQKIDDSMATVFRQVTMNRFEAAVHTIRRDEGELTTERFGDVWIETQTRMYGQAVTLGDHYRRWWSYIPHFVHTPGYVYAYAFGELLVLALYARYRDANAEAGGQDGFTEAYLDLLRSGGSDWPHVLVGRLGIDLRDPAFWQQGLRAIENLIAEAEAAADKMHGG